MLTDLARAHGVADCLAKFAIDDASMRKMEAIYAHLSPEKMNELIRNRINAEAIPRGKENPNWWKKGLPVGAGSAPAVSDADRWADPPKAVIPGGPTDKTVMSGGLPQITAPSFAAPAPAAPVQPRPAAGSAAGTNPGRPNPLLAKRGLPR